MNKPKADLTPEELEEREKHEFQTGPLSAKWFITSKKQMKWHQTYEQGLTQSFRNTKREVLYREKIVLICLSE